MQRAQHLSYHGIFRGISPNWLLAAGLFCLSIAALSSTLTAADGFSVDATKRAINTVCPVSGKKIDPAVEPVKATKDGTTVMIGADNAADAAVIRANPEKYVDAALANRKADP